MEYPIDKKIPKALFVQLLTDKALMLKKHLKDMKSDLQRVANINPSIATIKLYNIKQKKVSQKLHVTISNLGDINEQLYQLWLPLNYLLETYCPMRLFQDWL